MNTELDKMKIRSYELSTSNKRNEPSTITYWVTLTKQPLWNKIIADIYHWYDMHIYKIPGWKLISKIHRWIKRSKSDNLYIPLANEQDIRCFHLSRNNHE